MILNRGPLNSSLLHFFCKLSSRTSCYGGKNSLWSLIFRKAKKHLRVVCLIISNHNAFLETEASTTSALILEYQQLNSKEDFSTGSFNTLENVSMTSAERGKFSTVFNAQSNETSVEKHSLQRCLSLTHADQEDTASVLGISELLKATEEPQAQILKHDLEIPCQAKITSIPLSSFPPKIQQLMSARTKNVSEVRQATETPTVIYVWPVIKMEEAPSPLWDNFPRSLIPTSPNLTRHSSSPDVVIEDVKCSQITPVKQLAQGELDRKTARSYPLIVKSSNSVVSGILKSLTNIKNKDYKNMLPLSSIKTKHNSSGHKHCRVNQSKACRSLRL
uniref:Uncharacterized protein n=1 Tax=Buteo japonicus TaxID=224669 RepID=A0A8C0B2M9_9AVES